jgi:hypothetical protein
MNTLQGCIRGVRLIDRALTCPFVVEVISPLMFVGWIIASLFWLHVGKWDRATYGLLAGIFVRDLWLESKDKD